MINNDNSDKQIQFGQKGLVEAEEKEEVPLSQVRAFMCLEGKDGIIWSRIHPRD